MSYVSPNAVRAAHAFLRGKVNRTPVLSSAYINRLTNREVFFKCENLQQTGVFKIRGALNGVHNRPEGADRVVTHSSGNHAAAIACAAHMSGLKAEIVMPSTSPQVKVENVKFWNGNITFCEPTLEAREKTCEEITLRTGAHFIHPYNDEHVIAGQGTIGMEFFEQNPDLDVVIVPIGGGGMISGIVLAAQNQNKPPIIIAAEPAGANDASQSKATNTLVPMLNPNTIADGLRTQMGSLTWPIVRDFVHSVVEVSDEEIIESMKLCMTHLKTVLEPSAGVGPGVLLNSSDLWDELGAKKIGVIICGGNVDLNDLSGWIKN